MTDEPYRDFNPYTDRDLADFTFPSPTRTQRVQAFAAGLPLVSLAVPSYPIILDVNHWIVVDLAVAKQQSNIAGVIVKLTEGDGIAVKFKDPKADAYIRTAVDLGIPVGVFHFFRQNWSGDDQARWFLDNAEQYRSLPGAKWIYPHLDRETQDGVSNNETSNFRAYKWLTTVQADWKTPGIYTNLNNWNNLFLVNSQPPNWVNDFNWWWAHWTSALTPSIPSAIAIARRKFWQNGISGTHSWIPRISGVNTVVDHGYFLGTLQELADLVGTSELPGEDLSAILERLAALEQRTTEITNLLAANTTVTNQADARSRTNASNIAAINTKLVGVDQEISKLKADVQAAFARIVASESKNGVQDTDITNLKRANTTVANRLLALIEKLGEVKDIP